MLLAISVIYVWGPQGAKRFEALVGLCGRWLRLNGPFGPGSPGALLGPGPDLHPFVPGGGSRVLVLEVPGPGIVLGVPGPLLALESLLAEISGPGFVRCLFVLLLC